MGKLTVWPFALQYETLLAIEQSPFFAGAFRDEARQQFKTQNV